MKSVPAERKSVTWRQGYAACQKGKAMKNPYRGLALRIQWADGYAARAQEEVEELRKERIRNWKHRPGCEHKHSEILLCDCPEKA